MRGERREEVRDEREGRREKKGETHVRERKKQNNKKCSNLL